MSTFTVIDDDMNDVILEGATREQVQEHLNIKENTFYNCISEQRLCRRKYKIIPEYGEKVSADVPPDFANRWRAMQRLFGIVRED